MPGPKPSLKKKRDRPIKKAIAQIERRGGARVNAGRPPTVRGLVKRKIAIREVTEGIIRKGKLPLRVMINSMIHYDEVAANIEQAFADAMAENAKAFTPEQMIRAMELYSQIGDARMKAGHFAQMAAPYVHPKLSQITLDAHHTEHPRDLAPSATTDEARDAFRRLRASPYDASMNMASDERGDAIEAEILDPEREDA